MALEKSSSLIREDGDNVLRRIDAPDRLKTVFWSLFQSNDPFGEVFRDSMPVRLILCPTNGYYLNQHQFNAMIRTAKAINESHIFLSEIEGINSFSEQPNENGYVGSHFEVSVPCNYEDYINTMLAVENALYSPTGQWGIIISHEEHAVIGGERSFMEKFKQYYPDWSNGLSKFRQMWECNAKKFNSDTSWIDTFLNHVNV